MPKQRLINCDFFDASGFKRNLSNKAKLLYFMFLANADDKGFVGNGLDIAESLDQCEENFDNVLFSVKYVDALRELVEKGFVYEFTDKHNNKTYLIRHWFLHNKNQKFLTTNYVSYLIKVELLDNEYHLKGDKKEKPLKEKENKENQNKENELKDDGWKKDWDKFLDDLGNPETKENSDDEERIQQDN